MCVCVCACVCVCVCVCVCDVNTSTNLNFLMEILNLFRFLSIKIILFSDQIPYIQEVVFRDNVHILQTIETLSYKAQCILMWHFLFCFFTFLMKMLRTWLNISITSNNIFLFNNIYVVLLNFINFSEIGVFSFYSLWCII